MKLIPTQLLPDTKRLEALEKLPEKERYEKIRRWLQDLLKQLDNIIINIPTLESVIDEDIITNHSELNELDYASAGHTGFQPALGFTPENVANKITAWGTPADTQYPSAKLAKDSLDGKEPILTKGDLTAASPLSIDNTRQVIGGAANIAITNGNLTASAPLAFSAARQVLGGTTNLTIDLSAISGSFGWEWCLCHSAGVWADGSDGAWITATDPDVSDFDTTSKIGLPKYYCLDNNIYYFNIVPAPTDKIRIWLSNHLAGNLNIKIEVGYWDGSTFTWEEIEDGTTNFPENQFIEIELASTKVVHRIKLTPLNDNAYLHEIQANQFILKSTAIGNL